MAAQMRRHRFGALFQTRIDRATRVDTANAGARRRAVRARRADRQAGAGRSSILASICVAGLLRSNPEPSGITPYSVI